MLSPWKPPLQVLTSYVVCYHETPWRSGGPCIAPKLRAITKASSQHLAIYCPVLRPVCWRGSLPLLLWIIIAKLSSVINMLVTPVPTKPLHSRGNLCRGGSLVRVATEFAGSSAGELSSTLLAYGLRAQAHGLHCVPGN